MIVPCMIILIGLFAFCKQEGYHSLDEFLPSLKGLITEIDNGVDKTKKGTLIDKNDKSALRKFYEFILTIS